MKEKIKNLLFKGLTLEQISNQLNISAKALKEEVNKSGYPKLKYSVGVELEGYSTLGYSSLLNTLKQNGVDISFRSWQEQSLTGVNNWTLTTDGTVKGFKGQNGEKGMEIVSPPLRSLDSLEKILELIRDGEVMDGKHNMFKTNKTCGLHIHFGTEGMDKEMLKKVYTTYRLFEPFLDLILASSRLNNVNCNTIKNLSFDNAIKVETKKYWSVRTKIDRVTIEFRKHQSSTNFNKIRNWILILQQLIQYAEKTTLISILEKEPSFSYFYEIISNPNLIAYYNARKYSFEKKGNFNKDKFNSIVEETWLQVVEDTSLKN
jgi:hypothetical protein